MTLADHPFVHGLHIHDVVWSTLEHRRKTKGASYRDGVYEKICEAVDKQGCLEQAIDVMGVMIRRHEILPGELNDAA